MVLVDTSVWIRFLVGREPYASGLDDLLGRDDVAGHEMIFGELLLGDVGGARKDLLDAYSQMHHAVAIPHDEVVEFVRMRRLNGRGVGWVDINILASAVVGGFQVWTADSRFSAIASDLRIAYAPAAL
jgi:predicted nucleic acid-binding protein